MILDLVAAGRTRRGHRQQPQGDRQRARRGRTRRPPSGGHGPARPEAGQDEPPTCRDADDLPGASAERGRRRWPSGEVDVVGGTAWLWSADADRQGSVDVLLVDEAGQFSLANTVAVSPAAPIAGPARRPAAARPAARGAAIRPGAERSALGHLLAGDPGDAGAGEHATMPPDLGLFLDRTWRLHPDICRYTERGLLRVAAGVGRGPGAADDRGPSAWGDHRRARGQRDPLAPRAARRQRHRLPGGGLRRRRPGRGAASGGRAMDGRDGCRLCSNVVTPNSFVSSICGFGPVYMRAVSNTGVIPKSAISSFAARLFPARRETPASPGVTYDPAAWSKCRAVSKSSAASGPIFQPLRHFRTTV